MINMTLSNLRNSADFFNIDDVAIIINGKKKEELGYFVPKSLKEDFKDFMAQVQHRKKLQLLKRVAKAAKKDIIGDGAVSDGII